MPDEHYDQLRAHLTDDQLSVLIWAAITIKAFDRVSILSRHHVPARNDSAPRSNLPT